MILSCSLLIPTLLHLLPLFSITAGTPTPPPSQEQKPNFNKRARSADTTKTHLSRSRSTFKEGQLSYNAGTVPQIAAGLSSSQWKAINLTLKTTTTSSSPLSSSTLEVQMTHLGRPLPSRDLSIGLLTFISFLSRQPNTQPQQPDSQSDQPDPALTLPTTGLQYIYLANGTAESITLTPLSGVAVTWADVETAMTEVAIGVYELGIGREIIFSVVEARRPVLRGVVGFADE